MSGSEDRTITVIFDTDEYRGDHAADIQVTRAYLPDTPLAKILADATQVGSSARRSRAKITILPEVPA